MICCLQTPMPEAPPPPPFSHGVLQPLARATLCMQPSVRPVAHVQVRPLTNEGNASREWRGTTALALASGSAFVQQESFDDAFRLSVPTAVHAV